MASAIEHITECPVCTLVFTDPQVLPCDHSFCHSCIDRLQKGPTIKCPVCARVNDVVSVRPDFRLTQFLDALREKEAELKNTTNKEDPQCELCCEESGDFWCEDCQQWMCRRCKNTHLRTSQCRNHVFSTLATKAEKIKALLNGQTKDIRDSMENYQGDIRKLENRINNLESIQSEALRQSHDLREMTHKEINEHFDFLDLEIFQAMNSKLEVLERAKTAFITDFKKLQTQYTSLDQMICVNERKLVVDGDSIMEQVITICKTFEDKEVLVPSPLIDEIEISLLRSQTWDPASAVLSIQTPSSGVPKKTESLDKVIALFDSYCDPGLRNCDDTTSKPITLDQDVDIYSACYVSDPSSGLLQDESSDEINRTWVHGENKKQSVNNNGDIAKIVEAPTSSPPPNPLVRNTDHASRRAVLECWVSESECGSSLSSADSGGFSSKDTSGFGGRGTGGVRSGVAGGYGSKDRGGFGSRGGVGLGSKDTCGFGSGVISGFRSGGIGDFVSGDKGSLGVGGRGFLGSGGRCRVGSWGRSNLWGRSEDRSGVGSRGGGSLSSEGRGGFSIVGRGGVGSGSRGSFGSRGGVGVGSVGRGGLCSRGGGGAGNRGSYGFGSGGRGCGGYRVRGGIGSRGIGSFGSGGGGGVGSGGRGGLGSAGRGSGYREGFGSGGRGGFDSDGSGKD